MKISFSKRRILNITIFLTFLAILLFGISYLINNIKKNSEKIVSQKGEILAWQKEEEQLTSLKKKYEAYFPNLLKLESLFVSPDNPLPFINFLEKMASAEGISFKVSSTSLVKEKENNYLVFNILTTSSYPEFFKFLTKIEKGPYLVEVYNLSLKRVNEKKVSKEKEGSSPNIGDVTADFSIKVLAK